MPQHFTILSLSFIIYTSTGGYNGKDEKVKFSQITGYDVTELMCNEVVELLDEISLHIVFRFH